MEIEVRKETGLSIVLFLFTKKKSFIFLKKYVFFLRVGEGDEIITGYW